MSNQTCTETEPIPSVDRHGHLICEPGATITDRYRIVRKLGKGSFSRVVEVTDTKTESTVALKVSRNKSSCRKAAKREIMFLGYIARCDPDDTSLCAKMRDAFLWHGHYCITFDILGSDVYHFLELNEFVPFPMDQVRHMAYQLCHAVNFLHQQGIIHTDLKTDNILFVDSSYTKEYHPEKKMNIRSVNRTDIRLIDLGCAEDDELPQSYTISNRCYRAPEVVLKNNWSHPVDVWSIGCILYELHTGNLLFNTDDDDLEHLAIMERILGEFPVAGEHKYFPNGKLNFDWTQRPLEVHCHQPLRTSIKAEIDDDLIDLMEKMLAYEPAKRITLKEALTHPFFDKLPASQRLTV
ncbi:serine/threonine-protein kinase Doa-like [Bradysia coprophila]|uniref:serine/threonine-protein kinase Doa-like n=1 Tax=Bradysia coprophila TaxID=38358 RepID=UPI00187DD4FF|nr:serine/threonine-protein kinase Doa-like [Bradysia coprophila]